MNPPLSRRRFLRASAAATALAAGPRLHAAAEGEPVTVGVMGLNGRGTELVTELAATGRVQVTWLVDPDVRALEKGQQALAGKQPRPPRTDKDFRRILEDRRTEALVIAAPDHWHAPASLLALAAGKAVYVEKPLSHNPREGELLAAAVKRTRGVLQMGVQRRSLPWVAEAIQKVRGGELGEVYVARAWYVNRRDTIGFGQLGLVPDGLDYALWQGPAPDRPFKDNLIHYNWHWFWHWGTGELGNNGVHLLDLARWGLGVECPSRVASGGGRYFFDDDQETPDSQAVTFDFGGEKLIQWEHRSSQPTPLDGATHGVQFLGTRASLLLDDTGWRIRDLDGKEVARGEGQVATAPHLANFLDAVRNRARTLTADAEQAQLSTLMCHLGNIAQRLGRNLTLNPKERRVAGTDREVAALWTREYRPGWEPAGL
ncbi:MAG: Gfo/Idh/MocA family protein [Limisphaerales bacterium]